MNRRQLLAGLGALAGGAGIVTGTGAFTSVNASRDATAAVADDATGFLSVFPSTGQPNGTFAIRGTSNGQISFDFNDANNTGGSSEGVGQSSRYEFDDVFRVENAGTQTVYVNIDSLVDVPLQDQDGSGGNEGDVTLKFYVRDPASQGPQGTLQVIDGNNADLELSVGAQRAVGVLILTDEEDTYGEIASETGTNVTRGTQTTIEAEQSPESGNGIDPGLPEGGAVSP